MTLLKLFEDGKNYQSYCWIMRQAGRYLPEYRALRSQYGSFFDLCFNPEAAAEVTLQPLKRFDLDAAIIFSDILIVPHALGLPLEFIEGQGPKLKPIHDPKDLCTLQINESLFKPTCEALSKVKAKLSSAITLIGFAGAPWTVACYMIEGGSSKNFDKAKAFALRYPEAFRTLLSLIAEATLLYLKNQLKAGAQLIQIFESWGEAVPDCLIEEAVYGPTQKIVAGLKAEYPHVPILGFPRGLGEKTIDYMSKTRVDGISLDSRLSVQWVKENLRKDTVLQGGIDPQVLVVGGDPLRREVERYRSLEVERPYIFNLGHGIVPETPLAHVEAFVRLIKGKP